MNFRAGLRVLGISLITVATPATLRVNHFTLIQIPRSITSVPYMDQWLYVRDTWNSDVPPASTEPGASTKK